MGRRKVPHAHRRAKSVAVAREVPFHGNAAADPMRLSPCIQAVRDRARLQLSGDVLAHLLDAGALRDDAAPQPAPDDTALQRIGRIPEA